MSEIDPHRFGWGLDESFSRYTLQFRGEKNGVFMKTLTNWAKILICYWGVSEIESSSLVLKIS